MFWIFYLVTIYLVCTTLLDKEDVSWGDSIIISLLWFPIVCAGIVLLILEQEYNIDSTESK